MSIVDKFKNLTREKKIIMAVSATVVVAAVVIVCVVLSRNNYLASTMRLLRVEGTVNIEDSKGSSKPVSNNMRFQSGDALNTGSDGLASVGLDDTKIVTLQNDSRAEFLKKGKQLELKLTKGAVFFNVTEKLQADETFEIKTSTMTAGIRGTSGIVYFDETDDNRESLIVTDGVVEVSATNKSTGITKTARVEAGERIKVYLFDDEDPENSVQFELDKIPVDELGNFNFSLLADDEALMKKISEYTGWDEEKLKKVLRGLAPTPTPTPTETPSTEEDTPTPTPTATDTPTPSPTVPPTNTPKPTSTPKPTNTPKPKATATTKPTSGSSSGSSSDSSSDGSSDDSSEGSSNGSSNGSSSQPQSEEPEVPGDFDKFVWGKTYNGKKVYIVTIQNEEFMAWNGSEWVEVFPEDNDDETIRYYKDRSGKTYYAENLNMQTTT